MPSPWEQQKCGRELASSSHLLGTEARRQVRWRGRGEGGSAHADSHSGWQPACGSMGLVGGRGSVELRYGGRKGECGAEVRWDLVVGSAKRWGLGHHMCIKGLTTLRESSLSHHIDHSKHRPSC